MNLSHIADMIVAAGQGVIGKTLFIHHMPETCAKGVVLRTPLDGIPVNNYLPDYYQGKFQVIIRDKTHASGQPRADALFDLLEMYNRDFLDKKGKLVMRIVQSYPCTKPIVYPRSPDNLIEWSITFDVTYLEL